MNELDFTLEFNSPLASEAEIDLFTRAETRLKDLAEGHTDMTGAAVNIREPAKGATAYLYEATVVVYSRPEHVAATEKHNDYALALKGALDGVERQIRQRRTELSERWKEPGKGRVAQEIGEVVAAEAGGMKKSE